MCFPAGEHIQGSGIGDTLPPIVQADGQQLACLQLAPYVVKITKMWRKLGAWFWLVGVGAERAVRVR